MQASLRGYITRSDMDKTSRTQKLHRIDSDEEDISDRKRDPRQQHFGDRYGKFIYIKNPSTFIYIDKIGSHSRMSTYNRDSPTRLVSIRYPKRRCAVWYLLASTLFSTSR